MGESLTIHTDKFGRQFTLIRHEGRIILHVGDNTGLDIVETDGWKLTAEIRRYLEDYSRQKEEWKKMGMSDEQFTIWKDSHHALMEEQRKKYMSSPVHALDVEYNYTTLCGVSTNITRRASKKPDEITCPDCLEKIRLIRIETRMKPKPQPTRTPTSPERRTPPTKRPKKLKVFHCLDPNYDAVALCGLAKENHKGIRFANNMKLVNCMKCLDLIDEEIREREEKRIKQAIQDYNDGKLNHMKRTGTDETKLKDLYDHYHSASQIGKIMNINTVTIKNKIKIRGWTPIDEHIMERAVELAESSIKMKECIDKIPGMNPRKFEDLRRRYNYRIGGKCKQTCSDCGKEFNVPTAMKRCEKCWETNEALKRERYNLRMKYIRLAYENPIEAENMVKDMEIVEGKNFREFALDGIPEKIKKKRHEEGL